MGIISYQIPVPGQTFATEAAKVDTALTTLLTLVNGNVDETNLTAALAQSAGVNVGGVGAKGVCVNAGPGTRTNTAYGALNDAPDQVTGIVLPTNGLITVWYQATWQESVSGAAQAALFIGANQLKAATAAGTVITEQANTSGAAANVNEALTSSNFGLVGQTARAAPYVEVTTGQIVGQWNGSTVNTAGPCSIFAAAGTYTVSVQFKASSGTVTASSRKLWVKAESFA